MKRLMSAALVAALGVTCLGGCQAGSTGGDTAVNGKGVKIYVSLSQADAFRNTLIDAAKKTAEASGAEIVVYDAENSIENQVAQIKQAVAEDYDAIMCGPVDADTALELEALAGDIPIVFYNSCPDASVLEPDKYIYVGSDEGVAGQYQAEYILYQMSDKDEINVVLLKGPKNHSATKGRSEEFKNTLKASGKKINVVFEDNADWEQGIAEDYFDLFLQTGKQFDAVVCNNDTMALGVIDSCKKNGISGVPVLGIDATADGCAAIQAGDMAFTVYQSGSGQGEAAVKAAIALGSGGTTQGMEGLSDDGLYVWVPFEKVEYTHVTHTFGPVYDDASRILILGSFPSVKSREQQFYYGHPQNRFWKVLAAVFEDTLPETIPQKKAFLLEHHIALWDVIASCDIAGSSDSSIRNVTANDMEVILKTADIRRICANGDTAYRLFSKYCLTAEMPEVKKLPSTSPANAAWNLERLTQCWAQELLL